MAATYLQPVSGRRRALSIALTIAVHLLLIWALLHLGPRMPSLPGGGGALSTFDVAPDAAEAPAARRNAQRQPDPVRPQAPAAPPVAPPRPPVPFKDNSGVIWLTREQYAATDITGRGSARGTDQGETADAGGGAGSGDSKTPYGPGAGPGGARLYRAEWVREPSRAELATFMPPADAGSWGEIACRTIPNNRVENCQILGENPRGSGLATGMRRAAWQFQVRPPRQGGKPLIGEWVRIRITYNEAGANAD